MNGSAPIGPRGYARNDPSLDIAIHPGYPNDQADHMILDRELAITPTIAQQLNVGIGDEIFITGLFANYTGEHRNVPILRVGNLAAYPQERVQVQGVEMDAYLIEARSIGGLSGSPVFYHSHGSHVGILRPSFPVPWALIRRRRIKGSPSSSRSPRFWTSLIKGRRRLPIRPRANSPRNDDQGFWRR